VKMKLRNASQFISNNKYTIVMVLVVALSAVSFAQEPVNIEIPVEDTITYLNQWVAIFAPIFLFIGMIPVALGLLRYITRLFASAFGGGGR
jgi:peptidoglycan biosynthesis protein MviN/MurJ (putative lipid II flippase)